MILYISFAIALFTCLFFLLKKKYSYWSDKGVKGPVPIPFFGNFGSVILQRRSIFEYAKSIYLQYPQEKVVGLYRGVTPVLLVRDPELIKQITIKDFNFFQDRGTSRSKSRLSDNLFSAEGETWRILRQKLTPTFTSKKLKDMLPLLKNCVDNYIKYIEETIKVEPEQEIKTLASKYTLDVTGSCAFGLDLDIYSSKKNVFSAMGNKIFSPSLFSRSLQSLDMIVPGIRKIITTSASRDIMKFFVSLVTNVIREREGKPLVRRDFMDLLIELKEQGKASRVDNNGISEIEIDDELMAAQALVFYTAGFETSSTTTSFLLYELAMRQDMQERAYKEICDVLSKYNGEFNLESIKEMTYLKMILNETLRVYSVTGVLLRKCTADYTFSDINLKIEKGTPLFIPVSGLQADPKYFDNPGEFNPENFTQENINKTPQCAYIPFGIGPRHCIGMRFAELQTMLGAAAFLKKFKVEPSPRTKTLIYDPKALVVRTLDGIWLKISERSKCM